MFTNQLFEFGKASTETQIGGWGGGDSPMYPLAEELA
jgi:hypothetical protein